MDATPLFNADSKFWMTAPRDGELPMSSVFLHFRIFALEEADFGSEPLTLLTSLQKVR